MNFKFSTVNKVVIHRILSVKKLIQKKQLSLINIFFRIALEKKNFEYKINFLFYLYEFWSPNYEI